MEGWKQIWELGRDRIRKCLNEMRYRADVMGRRQIAIAVVPPAVVWYLVDKAAWLYRYCVGKDMFARMVVLLSNPGLAFYNPDVVSTRAEASVRVWMAKAWVLNIMGDGMLRTVMYFIENVRYLLPSLRMEDAAVGFMAALGLETMIMYRKSTAKKYRHGVEYGSARWGKAEDIRPFIDPVFENNMIFTQTERMRVKGRPKHPKYDRNKNVCVVGGSGSGKTRFYCKPNLMQVTEGVSYVFTDPKGTVVLECGRMLVKHGYKLRILNTINFAKSHHYNPFAYIKKEKDILKLVNIIIANTIGEGEKAGEDFWIKSERLLYCAFIGYIWYEAPEEEKNFITLLEMINASEAREDDENFKNVVDIMFEKLEKKNPRHFAVRQNKKYKLAAGVKKCRRFLVQPTPATA